jgi:mRNA interferase MazF
VASEKPPRRGDVALVCLDPVEGSEQGGRRPAFVLSPDLINEHSPVVVVAAITSRKADRVYPFEAKILPTEGGLKERSKVLLMQLRSLDKGHLGPETMHNVEEALKVATGLVPI